MSSIEPVHIRWIYAPVSSAIFFWNLAEVNVLLIVLPGRNTTMDIYVLLSFKIPICGRSTIDSLSWLCWRGRCSWGVRTLSQAHPNRRCHAPCLLCCQTRRCASESRIRQWFIHFFKWLFIWLVKGFINRSLLLLDHPSVVLVVLVYRCELSGKRTS